METRPYFLFGDVLASGTALDSTHLTHVVTISDADTLTAWNDFAGCGTFEPVAFCSEIAT